MECGQAESDPFDRILQARHAVNPHLPSQAAFRASCSCSMPDNARQHKKISFGKCIHPEKAILRR
jgi:hypothetical protein